VRDAEATPSRGSVPLQPRQLEELMSVAKVSEISATSDISFEDAINEGIRRAAKTLKNVSGAWIQDQKVDIENNKIVRYRVNMKVTFVLSD
jgi:flavin-binding protein dodecin